MGEGEERDGVRQQAPPKRADDFREEARCSDRVGVIEPVAVEFRDPARAYYHARRVPVLEDVEGEQERGAERWGESVVGWGGEC